MLENNINKNSSAYNVKSTMSGRDSYLDRKLHMECQYNENSMITSLYMPTKRILCRTEINAIEYPSNGNISSKRQLNENNITLLHPIKRLKVNKDDLEFIYLKTRGSAVLFLF